MIKKKEESHELDERCLNIPNLKKLSPYLHGYSKMEVKLAEFGMRSYASGNIGDDAISCGTAGCAVGHAPYAGILKTNKEGWTKYSHRALIDEDADYKNSYNAWAWCFSGAWGNVDDTANGAACRIDYLLEHGIPLSFDDAKLDDIAEDGGDNPWYEEDEVEVSN